MEWTAVCGLCQAMGGRFLLAVGLFDCSFKKIFIFLTDWSKKHRFFVA